MYTDPDFRHLELKSTASRVRLRERDRKRQYIPPFLRCTSGFWFDKE